MGRHRGGSLEYLQDFRIKLDVEIVLQRQVFISLVCQVLREKIELPTDHEVA